jgi:hypothetical protein
VAGGRDKKKLHRPLSAKLETARGNAARLARPISGHGEDMTDYYAARRAAAAIAQALWTNVPTASDQWVRVVMAMPEQVLAALDCLRSVLTAWEARRPAAASVVNRLESPNLPTAGEYAVALHNAEMLVFASEKLLSLYAGIIYSMPIYRLYPATAEAEAIALWWPWGRSAPLVDGGPPRPPKRGKKTLDPSLITATRPQDVVREVMQKTGIDRTTAQRMTAAMRAQMRRREIEAEHLLHLGHSKSEVARRVGLSASRISAMFKGEESPNRRVRRAKTDCTEGPVRVPRTKAAPPQKFSPKKFPIPIPKPPTRRRAAKSSSLIVAKNRHGPVATVELHFNPETTQFLSSARGFEGAWQAPKGTIACIGAGGPGLRRGDARALRLTG